MLTIWGRRSSINVQKVMWLVGGLGLPHKRIDVGGTFGGLDAPEFLRLNPHGRIPVLQDGETTVWESHAILRYLAGRYGGAQFWPDDAAARSHPDRWMEFAENALQHSFHSGVF